MRCAAVVRGDVGRSVADSGETRLCDFDDCAV
jgi:hypothetical protein